MEQRANGMGQRLGDQTYSEVVESGIGQPTPGDVFGELIQHLGVLGLEEDKDKNTSTWVVLSSEPCDTPSRREEELLSIPFFRWGNSNPLRSPSGGRPCSAVPAACPPPCPPLCILGPAHTHMHGKDAAGNELTVLPDAEVPRLYPHHVIKHELQVQPALHTHLETDLSQFCPHPHT